jgi:hypothetical protein
MDTKETITHRLMVFERKMFRKMFGPTYEDGSWQIKTNQELDKMIKYRNTINFGGLVVSMLAEAVGFFRAKKSSACLPSEGK